MKHIPSKPEVVAKIFIYSILAVGFAFGLMVPFIFWGGAGVVKAVPEKEQFIYSVLESHFFALILAVFIGIATYSAINGVPK